MSEARTNLASRRGGVAESVLPDNTGTRQRSRPADRCRLFSLE
jgi:hypothetical protein